MGTDAERLQNRVRRDRAEDELDALDKEFTTWLKRRREADPNGFHRAQIAAIEGVIRGASKHLRDVLLKLSTERSPRDFHRQSVLLEHRIAWLYKVWQHFRTRFDQRDGDALAVLRAADEVVWSCYRPALIHTKKDGPPPVPFIGYDYTPLAFLVSQVPAELTAEAGRLKSFISEMPCPEISLPVACVRSPWWLVLIGHEVGHHVYALLQLRTPFEKWLRGVAGVDGDAWAPWAEEVFADVYSVLVMGASALRAIRDFDTTKEDDPTIRRERYPSLVARLALLAATARALKCSEPAVVSGLDGVDPSALCEGNAQAKRDLAVALRVAEAVDASWTVGDRSFTLKDLVGGFDATLFDTEPVPDPTHKNNTVATARRVASISVRRWVKETQKEDDGARRAALQRLREETLTKLRDSAPEGDRPAKQQLAVTLDEQLGELLGAWNLAPSEIG